MLVLIDTLRADHLGCYGYSRPTSPRLDQFAADAVLFKQAVSPSPWTLPALATLMTSLYPSLHGARSPNTDREMKWLFEPENFRPVSSLHESRTTLAEILRGEGFSTIGLVQGSYPSAVFGFAQGFEQYFDNKTPGIRFNVEQALRWLDDENPARFLIYLHVGEVHSPYEPPEIQPLFEVRVPEAPIGYFREAVEEERARFRAIDFDPDYRGSIDGSRESLRALKERAKSGAAIDERDVHHLVALYDRGIAYTDYWIGRLLDGLRERGLYDQSVIIITSDHGDEFLEHGGFEHGYSYYEEMLHVPLMIRLSSEGRGKVIDQAVGIIDVLPTVLDVLEIEHDFFLQGRSLRPLWRGGSLSEREHFGEASIASDLEAVRTDRWKYVRLGPTREELYDLYEDPEEQVDLCRDAREECEALRQRLDAWASQARDLSEKLALPTPDEAVIDEEMRERLRALGYTER